MKKRLNDCSDLPAGSKWRAICEGESGLPIATVNAYRNSWGLPLLESGGLATIESRQRVSGCGGGCGGSSEKSLPSLIQQGVNFTKSTARHAANGFRKASKEVQDERLAICEACPSEQFRASDRRCADCGCPVDEKVKRASEPCRLGHWSAASSRGRSRREEIVHGRTPQPGAEEVVNEMLARTEIVVKSFLRHPTLLQFIRSVRRYHPNMVIHVADDSFKGGQTNSCVEQIKNDPHVRWHSMPYDSGLSAGRNLAVCRSQADYIILCDDDFVFTHDTDLGALLLPIADGLDLCGGLVRMNGVTPQNWSGTFKFTPRGGRGRRDLQMIRVSTPIENAMGVPYRRCDVMFNFFAARRSVLLKHPWNEKHKISSEHLDSFLRWHAAGLKVGYTTACICSHDRGHYPEYQKLRRDPKRGRIDTTHKDHKIQNRALIGFTSFKERSRTNRLLPARMFVDIFEPLVGRHVGLVKLGGNPGDDMIYSAMAQLCEEFGIEYSLWRPLNESRPEDLEHLLIAGGGNMGTPYQRGRDIRSAALATQLPCTLGPQSWMEEESVEAYSAAFAREVGSTALCSSAMLAPDFALGYLTTLPNIRARPGSHFFLRDDRESLWPDRKKKNDPISKAKSLEEYLRLAASYRHIITDRLHFAIAGLVVGRRVTLLPNSYHKNRSMWETWLQDLGCEWADRPRDAS
jgi:glycosyltransferase involved in cell wall biosynthesis